MSPAADCEPAELAQLYGALVFKAAYRVLGDRALAEDVQQDVFLRMIEKRPDTVRSWPAYLSASASRAAIDLLRRQQRWRNLLPLWLAPLPTTDDSAQAHGEAGERASRLRSALARLSRREAQCFAMRYLEGLDIAEIALMLVLSENSVSVSLHRARHRLESLLRDDHSEDAV